MVKSSGPNQVTEKMIFLFIGEETITHAIETYETFLWWIEDDSIREELQLNDVFCDMDGKLVMSL